MTKLLIIDDEKTMYEFGRPFFERRGYKVFCVHTGKEGLEAFMSENPDVVLLDLGLPDMDGKDVLLKIRESGKASKVFVLTGFSEAEIKEKVLPLGPDAYFTKPCHLPVIAEKIESLLK